MIFTGALITKVDAGGILNDPEGITLAPTKIFTPPIPVATTSSSSTEPPAHSSANL
jgi:hypothetical protein